MQFSKRTSNNELTHCHGIYTEMKSSIMQWTVSDTFSFTRVTLFQKFPFHDEMERIRFFFKLRLNFAHSISNSIIFFLVNLPCSNYRGWFLQFFNSYSLQEMKVFRNNLQMLCNYDWVPIPLVYPQVSVVLPLPEKEGNLRAFIVNQKAA